MPLAVEVTARFVYVGRGTGPSTLGGLNADDPTQGQNGYPIAARVSQVLFFNDQEPVPGTEGSRTLANLNTALTNAVTALAGATGTPKITAAKLAEINGWATGQP